MLQMLVPRESRDTLTASIVYEGPVEAPIAAGQALGALVVEVPDQAYARFQLVAGRDVARGERVNRLGAATRLARDSAVRLLPERD
jgi:D-alanyl-D-alanine carboxypeptidase (penicillin-binding protein 5/6)